VTVELQSYKCLSCNFTSLLEHTRCPRCKGEAFGENAVGEGKLVTYTVLTAVAEGFEKPSYLGLAEFEGGLRILAQLAFQDAQVGMKVKPSWGQLRRKDGETVEGLKLERST